MTATLPTIDAPDAHVPVGTWTIDPAHSSIGFSVRHLMGRLASPPMISSRTA
jgi:polyisoprenoid-binding protein YceI